MFGTLDIQTQPPAVYAMYAQSRRVLIFLGFAFATEITCMVVSLVLAIPKVEYDAICTVTYVPTTILIYGLVNPTSRSYGLTGCPRGASVIFQLTLFILTTAKFIIGLRRGWGHTALVTLLARDGTWAFGLIFSQ